MFSLAGKCTVVTGGGRGVGRGIVRTFGEAGSRVVIAGRTPGPLEEVAEEVRSTGGEAIAVPTDITDRASLDALVGRALDEFGYIDCWVNNAGSANAGDVGPLIALSEAQWDAVVDLNMKWTFFAAQAACRAMTRGGSIINVTSRSALIANPMTGQYGAAKAGIENLTLTMAAEWGHLGVRVNSVAPGVILTEGGGAQEDVMRRPSRQRRQIETTPLRRLGQPEDIGYACVFLASDESSYISGTCTLVSGGSRISLGYLTYLHHVNERLGLDPPTGSGKGV
jgi:NAD(P)-dependent dehydrogenase (short-subunit alcohol dehydrogenase family)